MFVVRVGGVPQKAQIPKRSFPEGPRVKSLFCPVLLGDFGVSHSPRPSPRLSPGPSPRPPRRQSLVPPLWSPLVKRIENDRDLRVRNRSQVEPRLQPRSPRAATLGCRLCVLPNQMQGVKHSPLTIQTGDEERSRREEEKRAERAERAAEEDEEGIGEEKPTTPGGVAGGWILRG